MDLAEEVVDIPQRIGGVAMKTTELRGPHHLVGGEVELPAAEVRDALRLGKRRLTTYQCVFGVLAEHGIADGPGQRLVNGTTLDEVILSAGSDGFHSQPAVG